MSGTMGYVVLEWNRTSVTPVLLETEILDLDEAIEARDRAVEHTMKNRRTEYYSIARIIGE